MRFKRSGIVVIAIVLVLVVFAGIRLTTLRPRIDDAKANTEALREQVDALTQSNAELEYELEHSEDLETIENIARSKLGLVMPGEKIFFDVND